MSERILVVDDDEGILFLLTKALERSGYFVECAYDGMAGLQKLKSSPPYAVMLTDLMMPRMSGLDLIKEARNLDPYLEIIVITAAGSIESAITAMRDGHAYDYLLKPLDSMKQLSIIVERAAAHRKLVIERAVLQQRVEAQAQRLQALIGNVGEAILAVSADGVVTVANPAAKRLLDQQDPVNREALDVLPPKLVNIVRNWQAIAGEYPVSMEVRFREGSTHMLSLAPLPQQASNRKGWVMVVRDISSMRRLDHLRAQALQEAINRIRMPLAEAMSAVVDLNLHAPQDERVSSSLYTLTNVWERIQAWGDELVAVVQSEADWSIQPTIVDTRKLLEAIRTDEIVKEYTQRGGRLNLTIAESLPYVRTAPKMLYRLLQGLVKRAAVRSEEEGEINVLAREYQGQVWIEIRDDGPPVSAPDLMQVFDKSIADVATGSLKAGLELVRAKSMLDRMDGQLWVSGGGPPGSSIIICLPIIASSPAEWSA
ncbi:MAG: response regulator [Anaerolineales bacterium]|nr:response regulator [Anaerolineales bacterium]